MNYSGHALLSYLDGTDLVLSRTIARNEVDASVSLLKRPMLLSGEALRETQARNREAAARYVSWKANSRAQSRAEVFGAVMTIAEITACNIFPEGIFRKWPYNPGRFGLSCPANQICPPERIGEELERLCQKISAQLSEPGNRAEDIASRVEWELGAGPLHPFYDACGRISRCFSLLILLWMNGMPRIHVSRDEYYRAASAGVDEFAKYYQGLAMWKQAIGL